MKLFLIGLSKSGLTTVSKFLCSSNIKYGYVSAMDLFKVEFRPREKNEPRFQYVRDYNSYLNDLYKKKPYIISNNIEKQISNYNNQYAHFIIDGLLNPHNLIKSFDYNQDMIVFLNRLDNTQEATDDVEHISMDVIRDYCFWLLSSKLISKDQWIQYNYRLSMPDDGNIKSMGNNNIVYIVKSIDTVKEHLKRLINS